MAGRSHDINATPAPKAMAANTGAKSGGCALRRAASIIWQNGTAAFYLSVKMSASAGGKKIPKWQQTQLLQTALASGSEQQMLDAMEAITGTRDPSEVSFQETANAAIILLIMLVAQLFPDFKWPEQPPLAPPSLPSSKPIRSNKEAETEPTNETGTETTEEDESFLGNVRDALDMVAGGSDKKPVSVEVDIDTLGDTFDAIVGIESDTETGIRDEYNRATKNFGFFIDKDLTKDDAEKYLKDQIRSKKKPEVISEQFGERIESLNKIDTSASDNKEDWDSKIASAKKKFQEIKKLAELISERRRVFKDEFGNFTKKPIIVKDGSGKLVIPKKIEYLESPDEDFRKTEIDQRNDARISHFNRIKNAYENEKITLNTIREFEHLELFKDKVAQLNSTKEAIEKTIQDLRQNPDKLKLESKSLTELEEIKKGVDSIDEVSKNITKFENGSINAQCFQKIEDTLNKIKMGTILDPYRSIVQQRFDQIKEIEVESDKLKLIQRLKEEDNTQEIVSRALDQII